MRIVESGELKTINQAYRSYRLEASARGERALRYDAWMQRYREDRPQSRSDTASIVRLIK